jgi:methionyl-tRNA formyltransferase
MLKVVVLGMTGRPLAHNVVRCLINSKYEINAVCLQKRFKSRGPVLSLPFRAIRRHGLAFILARLREMFMHKREDTESLCAINNICYYETDDINSKNVQDKLREARPDVIILAGPPIIHESIFSQANCCTINSHRSLLPAYAGLDAIFWALYHGEKEIGATVHTVNKDIDAGEIIVQRWKRVDPADDVGTLTEWYYQQAPEMILAALDRIANGDFNFSRQDASNRSYFSWPTKKQRRELRRRLKMR